MKGARLCVGLLAAAPASGFFVPSSPNVLKLQRSTSCGHREAWRTPVIGVNHNQIANQPRGSRSLMMTKPSLTTILGTALIIISTIGVSTLPFLQRGPETAGPKTIRVVDDDGNAFERGTLTSLTRPEIQKKLAQIPVFFLRDESGAVHVEGGEGVFFMSPGDAKSRLQELKSSDGVKVAATTLDDVWYPLVKKKGLNKKPVAAEASASSDLSASYRLVPRSNQVAQAVQTAGWDQVGDKAGVPVWNVPTLAFRGTGSKMKVPLFTNVDDLMTSWERLKTEAGSETTSPTIQVSSIGAIIDMMERGGSDNRNLEFFADMESIEQAEQLL